MTSPRNRQATEDPNLANFLFTITKTDEGGVSLESMEGTAWKKLGFRSSPRPTREYINAYGTVNQEK